MDFLKLWWIDMRWIYFYMALATCLTLTTHAMDGQVYQSSLRSRTLKNTRDVWIYTPPGYNPQSAPYPLLIVFDGQAYNCDDWVPTPTILDHLINQKKIRPVVAVFISSLDQRRRNKELPCYEPFACFLANTILPWIHEHYHLSQDPKDVILVGSSYGGLAAAYAAYLYPQKFGNVLSQSGAFYWCLPRCDRNPSWIIRQYESGERRAVRFHLQVGDQETQGNPSIVSVNRQMRDVLKKRGYEVSYHEFRGGHEYHCWKDALPQGLSELLAPN